MRARSNPDGHIIVDASVKRAQPKPLHAAVLERLKTIARPQSTLALRNTIKVRKAVLVAVLETLRQQGDIERTPAGWTLTSKESV